MIERATKVTLKRDGGVPATVLGEYMPGMYEVRIFSGSRHVGDIVVPASDFEVTS